MSPREKKNTERTYVFLPPEVLESLKNEAEEKGLTVSGLIRMIVLEHEKKNNENVPGKSDCSRYLPTDYSIYKYYTIDGAFCQQI